FDDTDDGGDTVLSSRDYLKTPRWSGLAQLTRSPTPAVDAYVGLKYTGRMWVLSNNTARLNRTADFRVVDAGATWHLGDAQRHWDLRSEEHTSELQSRENLVCRLLLEKKNTQLS